MNAIRRTVLLVDGAVVTGIMTTRSERTFDALVTASGLNSADLVLLRDAPQ